MKRYLLGLLLWGSIISTYAQSAYPDSSLQRLRSEIEKALEQQPVAGLMVGITTKDTTIFAGGFGDADIEAGQKVDADTKFRLGSITKMMVALAVLQLAEKHQLDLSTPVKEQLPDLAIQNPWEETHPLRWIHLLEHTSGFDDCKLNRMYGMEEVNTEPRKLLNINSLP